MDPGARLQGRYVLGQRVGTGGTAEVWRAWDELLDRHVAVKLVSAPPPHGPAFRRRFGHETRAAAALSHPRVVVIFDCDEAESADGDRIPYVVTEFLEGETLADRIRRGALPVDQAVRVCAQIADALAAAHRVAIVHCALKPTKVFLTPEGAKVLDFGVARAALDLCAPGAGPGPARPRPGTSPYLAPEERSGRSPATMAPPADVYALGVVLTEALTARRALDAPLPDGIPPEVAELCSRCRAHDPAARPSAAEVAQILTASAAAARPTEVLSKVAPKAARPEGRGSPAVWYRWLLVACALTIVACAAMVLPSVLHPHRGGSAAPVTVERTVSPSAGISTGTPALAQKIAALTRMRPIIEQGLAAGEIRSDVALDLDNAITNLQNDLTEGQWIDPRQRVSELQEKIATRLEEGGLTRDRADELNTALSDVSPQ